MKRFQFLFFTLFSALILSGCGGTDDSEDDDQGQLPMVFNVDPLLYKQYDIDISPDYSNVQVYAWAVFTPQPTASKYTLTYTCETAPHLSFEITWQNGEPIPDPGAPPSGWIPGYELGVIGGQYHIVILGSGCQGANGGSCTVNGETPNKLESNLRAIEGTVEVRIDFE
ncbi:hypothetical protein [Patiriisocius hiemis]|uniref:Lipoprotein n=1 Tax=Patiriisocius hiemis TaxID=3075604 RepID=A0ABU2Y9I2_9FLAO|nr:hypothetical protein [Constantimarinum sp. W242]MDT0554838.1 hypothetical protein [Constantimarinum sp. W242]